MPERLEIDSPQQLGSLVRSLRKQQGLTQAELGELAGVGARFVGELERGKATLRLGLALLIAKSLGIRLEAQWENDV